MRRVFRSPAERSRLVALFERSGMSAKAFAAREGINPSTMYQWLASRPKSATPAFVRVEPPEPTRGMRLQLGGVVLHFEQAPAAEYLATLMRALAC